MTKGLLLGAKLDAHTPKIQLRARPPDSSNAPRTRHLKYCPPAHRPWVAVTAAANVALPLLQMALDNASINCSCWDKSSTEQRTQAPNYSCVSMPKLPPPLQLSCGPNSCSPCLQAEGAAGPAAAPCSCPEGRTAVPVFRQKLLLALAQLPAAAATFSPADWGPAVWLSSKPGRCWCC